MRYLFCLLYLLPFIQNGWSALSEMNSFAVNDIDHSHPDSAFNINTIALQTKNVYDDAFIQKQNLITSLLSNPQGIMDTLISNDTILKVNNYKLRKRADLMVYHPYWAKKNNNYNYNFISTFSVYGYSLNAKTGGCKSLKVWENASEIAKALSMGCMVDLCVFHIKDYNVGKSDNLDNFFANFSIQKVFAQSICLQAINMNATGVNIIFDEMKSIHRDQFSSFVRLLSGYLKHYNLRLTVSIPTWCDLQIFDINELDSLVECFVLNFSKKQHIGPFASVDNINSAIDWILKSGVNSSKIFATLPLYGGLWNPISPKLCKYVPYAEIERQYLSVNDAFHVNNNSFIKFEDENFDSLTLWYDDAQTIAAKCDLIFSKKLSGVGLWTLEYDNDRNDIWNAVLNTTLSVDTFQIIEKRSPNTGLQLLRKRLKEELRLYKMLFERPCEFGESEKEMMVSDDIIKSITIIVISILILVIILYVFMYRSQGRNWKYQKLLLTALILLVILSVIVIFLFFFLSPGFSDFGINDVGNSCGTSLSTILKILGIGFLIGLVTMKFLILPLTRRKEIP